MLCQAFLERNQQRKDGECLSGGSEDSGSTKDDPDGRTSSESTQGEKHSELATGSVTPIEHRSARSILCHIHSKALSLSFA